MQSIGNCTERLNNYLSENKCNVVTVSEHWKSIEQLEAHKLTGFKLATAFCRNQGCHGGVAIYCQKMLCSRIRNDINKLSECYSFECAAAEVPGKSFKYVIVAIYRTPDSHIETFLRKMHELLDLLFQNKDTFIIAGDFNIDFKNMHNKNSQSFKSLLESYNVTVTINDYTRVNNTSHSCIDNILTNVSNDDFAGEVLNLHLSDHLAQKLTVKINTKPKTQFKYVRCFNQINTDLFLNSLNLQNWANIYNIEPNDVDNQWYTFMAIFENVFSCNFPIKKVAVNQFNEAYVNTPEILNCKRRLSTISVMLQHNAQYKDIYNIEKMNLENLLTEAKKSFYDNKIKISDNISKATWNVVENICGNLKKGKSKDTLFQGDPSVMANKLNDYFINTPINLVENLPQVNFNNNIPMNNKTFIFDDVTENEILHIVKSLKNKSSSGHDEVSNIILKKCIHYILKPLCYIINNSLKYGIFPDLLKLALIIPIYKNGDESNIENYRPISLLSSFSKIFEKVVYNQLLHFFNENEIFSKNQHGFLKGRSIETALFDYINGILNTIDNSEIPLGIFLDLSKAYDTINHCILKQKLERYGVRGAPLKWILSYLFNRQQYVKLMSKDKKIISETKNIRTGVPQGSILGPLLFNIYILTIYVTV